MLKRIIDAIKQLAYREQVLMVLLALGIILSFWWLSLKITITIILLIVVWAGDAYLKKVLDLGTATAFADLSFAAFIFAGSRGVDTIATASKPPFDNSLIVSTFVISVILAVLWIVNLSISKDLEFPNTARSYNQAWWLSIGVSCLSSIITLTSQSFGVI